MVLLSIYLRVALLVTGLLFVIVEHVTLKQRARVTSHSVCGSGIRHTLAGLRPLECPHDMAATSRDAESVPAQEEATVLYDLICHFRNVLLITGVSRIRCARGPHQDGSSRSEDPWGCRVPWDHSGAKGLPGSVRNRALPGWRPPAVPERPARHVSAHSCFAFEPFGPVIIIFVVYFHWMLNSWFSVIVFQNFENM